jgi:hypothetical protein
MQYRAAIGAFALAACSSSGGDRPGSGDGGANGPATDAAAVDAGGDGRPVDAPSVDAAAIDAATGPACPGARPDATNTGVPAGVTLKIVNTDVTVTTDGTVIDAQDIHGFLTIKASHVRVTRTILRGRGTTATTAILRIDSGSDISITDTEIAAATPSVDLDGVWASGATLTRVHVRGGVDGIKLGDDTRVECSFIHDLVSFDSDPNQGGGPTHNDAIQILSGARIAIIGNQLVAARSQNAAIQITQDFGAVSDVRIERNWADGGGCTFNLSHNGGTSLAVTTRNNRFGRDSSFSCPILKSTKTTLNSAGDVFDDTGAPVPVQTHD